LSEECDEAAAMQTELLLDYATILANQARPIHFALRFTAPAVAASARQPAAFCVGSKHTVTETPRNPTPLSKNEP
jgi:hypothetical protein